MQTFQVDGSESPTLLRGPQPPLPSVACTHTTLAHIVRVLVDVPGQAKVTDLHHVTF